MSFPPFIAPFSIARLPRIEFGSGVFGKLPDIAAGYGRRLLVVTGARSFLDSARATDLFDRLRQRDIGWEILQVAGEPAPTFIDASVAALRGQPFDVVVGIGGGSEATKNAVLSIGGQFKKSFRDDRLVAEWALVDPDFLATCPPDLIAADGMDAFTQLLESFVSTRSNPMTDALAKSGLGAVHGLAAPLGAFFPVPHGVACGTLVAHCRGSSMRTNPVELTDAEIATLLAARL
jgi:alcohol dehydrogenase